MAVYTLDIAQGLAFNQSADASTWTVNGRILNHNAAHTLTFTQKVRKNLKILPVAQSLAFRQTIFRTVIYNQSAAQALTFSQVVHPKVLDRNVSQTLIFSQVAQSPRSARQTLTFAQTVSYEKLLAGRDTLVFAQILHTNFTRNMNVSQSLTFTSKATCYKEHRSFLAALPPPELLNIVPPPTPTASVCGLDVPRNLTVSYFYQSYTLELPAPDFSNNENMEWDRINQRTRGGDLYVYRDSIWPKTTGLIYIWTGLKKEKAQEVLRFSKLSLGQLISLLDYENRTWVGVIRIPEIDISEERRDSYSVKIEFELE